jgi:hypothetical protein
LIPDAGDAPESSLSFMANVARKAFCGGLYCQAVKNNSIRFSQLADFLKKRQTDRKPVLIMTTSLALASFFDYLKRHKIIFRLAEGSRIMDTGGFKGRRGGVSPNVLGALSRRYLNISREYIVNEYGMTELTSQFYDQTIQKKSTCLKAVSPWTRILIINPSSGKTAKYGERGLIRIVDLANQFSCAFIQTEDEGILKRDGFKLIGRKTGSDLRGCSLTFEDIEETGRH